MQNKPQKPQKLKAFKFEGFTVAPQSPETHIIGNLYICRTYKTAHEFQRISILQIRIAGENPQKELKDCCLQNAFVICNSLPKDGRAVCGQSLLLLSYFETKKDGNKSSALTVSAIFAYLLWLCLLISSLSIVSISTIVKCLVAQISHKSQQPPMGCTYFFT